MLSAAVGLIVVGVFTIYAVGHPVEQSPSGPSDMLEGFWKKQLMFAFIGAVLFWVVNTINYRKLGSFSYWIFGVVLVMLAVLLLAKFVPIRIGNFLTIPLITGTRRWIRFSAGGFSLSIQPSEVCKLAYILGLAWYLRYRSNYRKFHSLIGPFAFTLLPMVLILLEPDLGTVLLMMPILFLMLFVAGAKAKHLFIVVLLALMVSPLMWMKMNTYQRIRISSVLLQNEWVQQKAEQNKSFGRLLLGREFSEKSWRNNWGYHLIRSKYAVASGGINGYGYRRGPFVKYNFLPERHNDFIFASIAHQWGFKGCLLLLFLYAVMLGCGLEIALHNTDPFARLAAVGIVAMFAVEVLVNISMTLGLMPITGLTLPLVSYGGSSLVMSMCALGLLNNIGRSRPFSVAPK
jgi:cell division protein FtsW (lipid II flippase)